MKKDKSKLVSSGTVVTDPLKVGTVLRFRTVPISPDFSGPTASLNNWDFFEGMLLLVFFEDQNESRVEGSAVLVAPGIAICATHVIEQHIERLMAGNTATGCQGVTSEGLQLWNIRKVTQVPNSDFTILGLELASALPSHRTFFQASISTRTPKVGEQLLICGFRAGQEVFPRVDGRTDITGEILLGKGPISDRYPTGRDTVMNPWPSLEVRCKSMGGMSGGPVFDSNGLLVGLLSSSFDFGGDDGISNVSMIWPALQVTTECVWPRGLIKDPITLTEMDRHLCTIDRPEAVERIPHVSGEGYQVKYHIWEE